MIIPATFRAGNPLSIVFICILLVTFFTLSLEELMQLEIITTSKYTEKIYDSPAKIYSISREQIQERGYQNVEDILRSLPGVDLQ